MTKFRALAAAVALLCLPFAPAHADTTGVVLSAGWQQIAPAGTAALAIQNGTNRPVSVTPAAAQPVSLTAPAQVLLPNERICWVPLQAIFAVIPPAPLGSSPVGSVSVTTGTGCVPTAAGGGGSGGSSTVNQGTPGSSSAPWFVTFSGTSVGVSSLPALVAGTAHIGSVNVDNFPSNQAVSWTGQTVGVSSLPATPAGTAHTGSVNVDNFPATQAVSWSNQAVAANLQVGGAANATGNPIFAQIMNFPATQAVSAASLPLPTGAATAANQTSEQSAAGTAASTLVGMQGGGTAALPFNDNLTQVAGSAVQTGTGASGAGVPRMTVANDSSVIISNVVGGYFSPTPSNNASAGALPATGNNVTALQVYGAAGNFFNGSALNYTANAGFLIAYNANAAPATGGLTPTLVLDCVRLPASGSAQINESTFGKRFSAGIILLVSSGSDCVTYTTGSITAFLAGLYR